MPPKVNVGKSKAGKPPGKSKVPAAVPLKKSKAAPIPRKNHEFTDKTRQLVLDHANYRGTLPTALDSNLKNTPFKSTNSAITHTTAYFGLSSETHSFSIRPAERAEFVALTNTLEQQGTARIHEVNEINKSGAQSLATRLQENQDTFMSARDNLLQDPSSLPARGTFMTAANNFHGNLSIGTHIGANNVVGVLTHLGVEQKLEQKTNRKRLKIDTKLANDTGSYGSVQFTPGSKPVIEEGPRGDYALPFTPGGTRLVLRPDARVAPEDFSPRTQKLIAAWPKKTVSPDPPTLPIPKPAGSRSTASPSSSSSSSSSLSSFLSAFAASVSSVLPTAFSLPFAKKIAPISGNLNGSSQSSATQASRKRKK